MNLKTNLKTNPKLSEYFKENQYIHYSNCHEDGEFMFKNIKNQPKRILSIASAFDNCLAMLLLNPNEIIAIDSNETQIYLCQLKQCGIKYLDYESFLVLIGVEDGDSEECYKKLRPSLDEETRNYFDSHKYLIDEVGLIHCGRFEYYFSIFKNKILPLIHSKKTINTFMNAETLSEQKEFYDKSFNNLRFRIMFKLFFSEAVMKRLGRDKEYFRYNKGSLSSLLKRKFEICVENNLNLNNPYLQYIVSGSFSELPIYLKRDNFRFIKQNIDKITIKKAEFSQIVKEGEKYDFMYLSDIFEYMDSSVMEEMSKNISNSLREGGEVLFFNMMNQRKLTADLKETKLDQKNNMTFYYTDCYLYKK